MATVVKTDLTPGTVPLKGRPKRGLRGAFFGLPYIGPVLTKATVGTQTVNHAAGVGTGAGAGGAAGTDGYREKDAYSKTGGEIEDLGLSSAEGGDVTAANRPTGRAGFTAKGIAGGSTPGAPIDATGRAESTGVDRFGRTKGVPNAGAGLGTYDYTNFDGRPTLSGDGGYALGAGRGSMGTDGETVTQTVTRAVIGTTAAPASGTIGIINGGAGGTIDIDIHADDIVAPLAGFEVLVAKRDADDTDEDGAVVAFCAFDGGTDILDPAITDATIAGTTVVVYARRRFIVQNAAGGLSYGVGPWSARTTLAVT